MKKILTILLIPVFALIFTAFQLENGVLERIIELLEKHSRQNPQEKIYLHLAKNHYATGEQLWYKAYLVNAANRVPQALSKVASVEIVSPKGEVIAAQKVKMEEGLGHGDIQIPKQLTGGRYTLRAYTNWMRNFDQDFFFTAPILVVNPRDEIDEPKNSSNEKLAWQVDFMPEGGELVAGLTSKVAFKATDIFGNGIAVTGTIYNDNGEEITTFKSFHDGMGAFILKPEISESGELLAYEAIATVGAQSHSVALPPSKQKGYVLSVDNRPQRSIRVTAQARHIPDSTPVYLMAQSHGIVYYTAQGAISNGSFFISLPKEELPEGIIQITLFNRDGMPECERLVFVDKGKPALTELSIDKQQYKTRQEVRIHLSTSSTISEQFAGSASLVVYPKPLVDISIDAPNIQSYLVLTSDLKGHINNANFYFQTPDREHAKRALDYLMMTQGWRRFIWPQVLGEDNRDKLFVEKYLTIKGSVIDNATGEPVPNADVMISVLGDHKIFSQTKTNEKGRFHFINSAFYGVEEVILRTAGLARQKDLSIIVDDHAPISRLAAEEWHPSAKWVEYATGSSQRQRISGRYHDTRRTHENTWRTEKRKLNNALASYPNIDAAVDLDDYISLPNMFEVIRELVPYVGILKVGSENRIRMSDFRYEPSKSGMIKYNYAGEPLYLIDGKPVFQNEIVLDVDPNNVRQVEVINRDNALAFGPFGTYGVMSLKTKNGNFELPDSIGGVVRTQFAGYHWPREFYNPVVPTDYSTPDFRDIIYWDPNVELNDQGEAVIEFYLGDDITSAVVEVEGVSFDGEIIRQSMEFDIVRK